MSARNYLQILGVTPEMSRLPQMANPNTLGPSFHTATQEDQRHYLGTGYDGADSADATHYPADPTPETGGAEAPANVCRLTRHPDGTADIVRLEATADGWIDTGGQTPRDMKVVNW